MPQCVNRGGLESLVRCARVPLLEAELALGEAAIEALGCWEARPGGIVTLSDPEMGFYRARLTALGPEGATAVPFEKFDAAPESPVWIEVYQALPQKERFELILQKLTEIGVSRIVPYQSRRSSTLQERDAGQKKSHRWGEVVLRAARQCRRAMLPELYPVVDWGQAVSLSRSVDLKLLLFEGEAPWRLKEILAREKPRKVALLVGPEGGFAGEEVEEAQRAGFLPVTVGPRILRTETAAIVGAALVQYQLGDLG